MRFGHVIRSFATLRMTPDTPVPVRLLLRYVLSVQLGSFGNGGIEYQVGSFVQLDLFLYVALFLDSVVCLYNNVSISGTVFSVQKIAEPSPRFINTKTI